MWLSPCLRQGLATDLADKDICSALGTGAGGIWKQWKSTGSAPRQNRKPQRVSNPICSHQSMFSSAPLNNDGITHMGKVKRILLLSKIYLDRSQSMQFSSEVFSADTGTLT